MITNALLHTYVTERSEAAFAELVRQHIDLVYSAALRQVNGDPAAAEDVTQAVFAELSRKAPHLVGHPSLTGWLYTSTRYIGAKTLRTERRRLAREQEACAMNQILQSEDTDPAWQQIRPVLDEAMHELNPADREAVLLRFFERRSVAEIGSCLGLTEDTARKRVSRALEKLRAGLARRGITSTVAALSVALAERTVGAAPPEIAAKISRAAVASGGVAGVTFFAGWKLWLGAAAVAVALGFIAIPRFLRQHEQKISSPAEIATAKTAAASPAANPTPDNLPASAARTPSIVPVSTAKSSPDSADNLILHIVAADTGQPIPSVDIDTSWIDAAGLHPPNHFTASPQGLCEVPRPRTNWTRFILVSRRDGFADTRLQWQLDLGQIVPQEYTLRLPRAVTIGGTVVDADGNPVAGATIGFGNKIDPDADRAIESSDFDYLFSIQIRSDSRGRWQMSRVTAETLRTLCADASYPPHLQAGFRFGDSATRKQLLDGNYEFRMGRGVSVFGSVVDPEGNPVPDARISVGLVAVSPCRQTNSDASGHFVVQGCVPEKTVLSAEAPGFAPATVPVDLSSNNGPFRLALPTGKLLLLRFVDNQGLPVTNVMASLITFDNLSPGPNTSLKVQTDFQRWNRADGRLAWSNAPAGELSFQFFAPGYLQISSQKIIPDGKEHTIVLAPALTVSGTARDAATGALLSSFRVTVGCPETDPRTGAVSGRWSSDDRFLLDFTGGTFRRVFEQPLSVATPNPGFIFKFEADGYASFVTRPVALDEGEVHLDVSLQPAAATTVTVSLPDGHPASGVDIGIVSPSARLSLVPGGFSRLPPHGPGSFITADNQGRFALPADDSVTRIVAAGAEGYAEATPASLVSQPVMVLQPWGRLEGTWLVQGRAITNCAVAFRFTASPTTGISTDFDAYQTKTDEAGRFFFPQVPPGSHEVDQVIELQHGSGMAASFWYFSPLTNVYIRPGETTTLTMNSPLAKFPGLAEP